MNFLQRSFHAFSLPTKVTSVRFITLHKAFNIFCLSLPFGTTRKIYTVVFTQSLTMSLSVLAGAGGLTSIGVGAGDIATLLTLGQRLGNWFTAPKGDADFLAMLEEDEASILTRRGTIDMGHFKQRWCKSIRLLANGVPQRSEGKAVEKLIEVSSKFTVSMMCIVAALDEFATASTVQNICKLLLRRLIPSTEVMEDLLISQIRVRISAWRSAGTVSAA